MEEYNQIRVLWITDPWDTLDHPLDTTLRLIQECLILGIRPYWAPVTAICLSNNVVTAMACEVKETGYGRHKNEFVMIPPTSYRVEDFTLIQYRADPPVTIQYTQALQLLLMAFQKSGMDATLNIQARAELLLCTTEKLLGLGTIDVFPDTIISNNILDLKAFGKRHGKTICKPINSCQSKGVSLLNWSETNAAESTAIVTRKVNEGQLVLLQEFLPQVYQGEKRVFFVNGEPCACIRKKPLSNTFLVDVDQGSEMEGSFLEDSDAKAVSSMGAFLHRQRICFAAADMIGGLITDINYVSPGLVVEAERLLGINIAKKIILGALSLKHTHYVDVTGGNAGVR